MAECPYCQRAVHWWQPLTTRRGRIMYCPHCLRALRVDKGRYTVLTGTSSVAIGVTMLLPTVHHYAVLLGVAALALAACVLFGKVVRADSNDDD